MILNHSGCAGKCVFVSSYGAEHLFHKILSHFCIIVKKQNIRGLCSTDSLVHSSAEAIIFRKLYDMDPGIISGHKRTTSVCGAIVYKNNLKISCGLPFQTSKYTVQKRNPVIIRYDYRYFHKPSLLLLRHSRKRAKRIIPFCKRKVLIIIRVSLFQNINPLAPHIFNFLLETAHLLFIVLCSPRF